jgi:hypothetical protein
MGPSGRKKPDCASATCCESGQRYMLWVTRDERPPMMVCDAITLPMPLRSKDRSCMPGTDQSVQVVGQVNKNGLLENGLLVMVGMINHVRQWSTCTFGPSMFLRREPRGGRNTF